MNVDPRDFRRTMGQFATGVAVIAVADGDQVHGMTANALTSLSLEPLLLLVCIDRRARMASLLADGARFSVNLLREDQRALSTFFAGSWREPAAPPFRFVAWAGLPRLEGCAAALGCVVRGRFEGGDHWIVTGGVEALHEGVPPRRPLVFFAGRYRRLDPEEGVPAPDLAAQSPPVQVFYDPWRDQE